jgi:uncharacterized protein (TIGR02588 family)
MFKFIPKTSNAEKITLSIASLILLSVIGLVIKVWLDPRSQQPPLITVSQLEPIRSEKGQFYVPFTVVNVGGGTAESVQIIAELQINGEVVESGEQQIDFLSGGETAEGAFIATARAVRTGTFLWTRSARPQKCSKQNGDCYIFSQNPQEGQLSLRAASYNLP